MIPINRAADLSNETARIAFPILVRRTKNWSRTWVSTEAKAMIRKILEKVMLPSGGACAELTRWMPSLIYHVTTSKGRW